MNNSTDSIKINKNMNNLGYDLIGKTTQEQIRVIEECIPEIFCDVCDSFVETKYEGIKETTSFNELEVKYDAFSCRCSRCNSLCYPVRLVDFNEKLRASAYRKMNGIIQVTQIRDIPHMYNIGKKPLSLALGWGELTFTRFFDGEIPSKEYSDKLTEIHNHPAIFLKLLEENQDRITKVAFKKCFEYTSLLIYEKDPTAIKVACYIKKQLEEVGRTALQKLLYYVQGIYAAFFNENCFKVCCNAWARGPVYPEIYALDRDNLFEDNIFLQTENLNENLLPSRLEEITNVVIAAFGCYSGDFLTEFTHSEMPWMDYRTSEDDSAVIPFEAIKTYFEAVKNKYNYSSPVEFRQYAKKRFEMISGRK